MLLATSILEPPMRMRLRCPMGMPIARSRASVRFARSVRRVDAARLLERAPVVKPALTKASSWHDRFISASHSCTDVGEERKSQWGDARLISARMNEGRTTVLEGACWLPRKNQEKGLARSRV